MMDEKVYVIGDFDATVFACSNLNKLIVFCESCSMLNNFELSIWTADGKKITSENAEEYYKRVLT